MSGVATERPIRRHLVPSMVVSRVHRAGPDVVLELVDDVVEEGIVDEAVVAVSTRHLLHETVEERPPRLTIDELILVKCTQLDDGGNKTNKDY